MADSIHHLILIATVSFAVTCAALITTDAVSAPRKKLETNMQIYRTGEAPRARAPEKIFMGDVTIEGYFRRTAPSRLAGATVTFAPGSRTPWKVNPLGQMLIVTGGVGRAQCAGGRVVEIRAGDTVWCPPGERH